MIANMVHLRLRLQCALRTEKGRRSISPDPGAQREGVSTLAEAAKVTAGGEPQRQWRPRSYWPFVTPALIVVLAVIIFPWLFTIWMSPHEWKVGSPTIFVGLANYWRLPSDPRFVGSVEHTLRSCTNASLNGNYGYRLTGQNVGGSEPGPRAAAGRLSADGHGNVQGTETKSKDGTIITGLTFTGSYNMLTDCTGTGAVTILDGEVYATAHAGAVLSDPAL
jgi:hypothetical protein